MALLALLPPPAVAQQQGGAVAVAIPPPPAGGSGNVVVLRGLDKITARITEFEAPVGAVSRFGTLLITPRTCSKRPPEEPPEVAAFFEIQEQRPGESEIANLFTGWMFASSPALSALEHPVYDVWVIDCKTSAGEGESPKE